MRQKSIPTRKFSIVFILIFSTLISFAYTANIKVKTGGQGPVNIYAPNISISATAKGTADILCADTQYLSEPGQPQIPWKVTTVLLPPDADISTVSYAVNNLVYKQVEGTFDIEPSPLYGTWDENGNPILVYPEGRTIVDGRDIDIYNADEFWPGEGAKISQKGRLRRWKLAEVAVPMVKYNPVTGKVEELVDADVDVTFERTTITAKSQNILRSKHRNKQIGRVKKIAANFDTAAAEYESQTLDSVDTTANESIDYSAPAGTSSTGYVIITTAAIESASTKLDDFVTHKTNLGWDVQVLTEADWGGGTGATAYTNLHTWLQNNYITEDILYVLLIGTPYPDTGTVPMRWYDDGRDGGAPTDFFYSSFTGDAYWEVVVGRIPYYWSVSIMDSILQKSIDYDNQTNIAWREKTLLAMARLAADTPMYYLGEQIKSFILEPQFLDSDRIYEEDFGVNPEYTYQQAPTTYMADVWAAKQYGMVLWSTHGNQTSAQYLINTGDVPSLNDNYPSVVFLGSCQNGWPENADNLAYKILQNGGITTVAGSRNTFYTPGDTDYTTGSTNGPLCYRYADRLVDYNDTSGLAWANVRQGDCYLPCRMRFNVYGDPSISLKLPGSPIPLSQSQPAAASSYQSGNTPQNGNDGTISTRWAAANNSYPQWWRVDLGSLQTITKVLIAWYGSTDRSYKYEIQISNDDSNYTTIVDQTSRTETGTSTDIFYESSRYVRVRVTGVSPSGGWAGFWECKVYGPGDDTTPPAAPTDLTASLGDGTIDLDWDDNTELDFNSYNVYRRSTTEGLYSLIASGLLTSDYNDSNFADDTKYYYAVTAADHVPNESDKSYKAIAYHFQGDFSFDGFVDMYDMALLGAGWQSIYDLNDLAGLGRDWLSDTYFIAYLPLDGDANDTTTWNQIVGVPNGNVGWDPCGVINGAVELYGADDSGYIKFPGFYGVTGTGSRTCCACIKTNVNLSHILTWGTSGSGNSWKVQTSLLGKLQVDVGGGDIKGTTNIINDAWHHIAVVLEDDGSPNVSEVKLYVDGQPEMPNGTSQAIDTAAGGDVRIGSFSSDPLYFNGLIDDIRIYDRALSQKEIEILAE
ncbi:MAG: discoidin domain-containing protein [Sedimentisphaerales bacterium]|nr:discoidin domain-containing protein [Sedimentisphaerales bacterium]